MRRSEETDEHNVLWIENNTNGLWANALYSAALSLIILTAGVIVRLFDGSSMGSSEMNRILRKVLTFPQSQLTDEFKKRLGMPLGFVDHSLPNKPPPIDPDSAKDNSSKDATDTYGGDNMGEIEDFLPAEDEDKQFGEA